MDPRNPDSGELIPSDRAQELQPQPAAAVPGEPVDCWNRIGVSGDRSCPQLAQVFHCRNCPVYSSAALQVLERRLPAGYRRQWTEHFALEKRAAAVGKQSVVLFRIGTEWLALPTRVFLEIAEQRMVHSLPHRRDNVVLGVVNIRGALLVCVSVGQLLGLEREHRRQGNRTIYERLVVAEWQGRPLVFPVDEVYGIHRHHAEELKELPSTVAHAGSQFSRGLLSWEGRLVGCLDEDLLFSTLNRSLA